MNIGEIEREYRRYVVIAGSRGKLLKNRLEHFS